MNTDQIKDILQAYFNASYTHDGDKMLEIFHDAAHIFGLEENGTLSDKNKYEFAARVSGHRTESPSIEFPRYEEILSIDFTGDNTAVARVKLRVMNTIFTDILSFARIEGKWGILCKILSGVPVED